MKSGNVINAWINGEVGKTPNKSIKTDGGSLFSYDLEIGYTDVQGRKVSRDYTGVYSRTTDNHIALANAKADVLENVGARVLVTRTTMTKVPVKFKAKKTVEEKVISILKKTS